MPVFMDYYVEHTFGQNASMNFSPNSRGLKPAPLKGKVPEQTLKLWLAQEDMEDGEFWALAISMLVALFIVGVVAWQAVVLINAKTVELIIGILIILGGLVGGIIIFFILFWILLVAFFPGNEVGIVTPSDEAIVKVSATHYSILAAVSYILYAAIRKMKDLSNKNSSAAPTVAAVSESEEIANIIQ